jgi:fucose permease
LAHYPEGCVCHHPASVPESPFRAGYNTWVQSPSTASRRAIAGFFLAGLIFTYPGAIQPAWDHHLHSRYLEIGLNFLALSAGFLTAVRLGRKALGSFGARGCLQAGSIIAAVAFGAGVFLGPPLPAWTRQVMLFLLGGAGGLLNAGVFQLITPLYERAPASTVNLGGILFGMGCLGSAFIVGFTIEDPARWLPEALFALISAGFALLYRRADLPPEAAIPPRLPASAALQDWKSPSAVLFALLAFFQFGNEWAIGGWLPLLLIQRLGISPQTAVFLLMFYWMALVAGRIAAQLLLDKLDHSRMLAGSAGASLFGCLILATTTNTFGATVGVLLVGAGFAAIYPLIVERTRSRFAYYHPVFFNGIFSGALAGASLAPFSVGLIVSATGLKSAFLIPLAGTMVVLALLFLIWIESSVNPANGD